MTTNACKTSYYGLSFFLRTIKECNELEPSVAEAESLSQFKTELGRFRCPALPHVRPPGGPDKSGPFGQVVTEKSIDSKHARCKVYMVSIVFNGK